MDASGHLLPYVPQYDSATHSLQANLPDGTYVLSMQVILQTRLTHNGDVLASKDARGANPISGSVEFTVAGHAVSGLRIPLGPSQMIVVHLRFVHGEAGPPGSNASTFSNAGELVNLTLDRAEGIPSASEEGVRTMEAAPDAVQFMAQPGAYWVNAFVQRNEWCADSFNAGGLNLAREPLVVAISTSTPPMELTMRDDCARLALNLPAGLTTFVPGEEPFYTVYVVPDFDTTVYIPPMTMHPSSGTTLNIDGLTPGSYHVYTFDTPVHFEYRNSAVIAALATSGQAITLTPGNTGSLVLEAPEH
jgi:hypothetical protein